MENYKISLQVLSSVSNDQAEIGLYAKNTVTLCEYATRCHFQTSFIAKLQKWLDRGRYLITDQNSTIDLTVQIFSFKLDRIQRDNFEVLKDEFQSLKNLSSQIEQEISVFTYQFLTQNWSDTNRQISGMQKKSAMNLQKVNAIAHHASNSDEQAILVQQQIQQGECLAIKQNGSKGAQILTVNRNGPETVRMEDGQGVVQQFLMYQVSSYERLENGQQYQIYLNPQQSVKLMM